MPIKMPGETFGIENKGSPDTQELREENARLMTHAGEAVQLANRYFGEVRRAYYVLSGVSGCGRCDLCKAGEFFVNELLDHWRQAYWLGGQSKPHSEEEQEMEGPPIDPDEVQRLQAENERLAERDKMHDAEIATLRNDGKRLRELLEHTVGTRCRLSADNTRLREENAALLALSADTIQAAEMALSIMKKCREVVNQVLSRDQVG